MGICVDFMHDLGNIPEVDSRSNDFSRTPLIRHVRESGSDDPTELKRIWSLITHIASHPEFVQLLDPRALEVKAPSSCVRFNLGAG